MHFPSSRRTNGFTLVELLVVISIIAVLAAAGFGAAQKAIQQAQKVKCLATCNAIESAVNNFYTEYGIMPKELSDDPAVPLDTIKDIEFLNVLMGLQETSSPELNSRKIKFLTVKEGKNKKDGLIYSSSGASVTGLYDPWGGAYYVMLDGNYDEVIKVKPSASTTESTLRGKRVAVWSNGADGINGTGGKANDDVKTW